MRWLTVDARLAAGIASRGVKVIGVDINQRGADLMNAGHGAVQENRPDETVPAHGIAARQVAS